MLLLRGHVLVTAEAYSFRASRAVVRVDELGGGLRRLLVFLEEAKPGPGSGPMQAEAPRLLVTATTAGQVLLQTDLLQELAPANEPLLDAARVRFADVDQPAREPAASQQPARDLRSQQEQLLREQRQKDIEVEQTAWLSKLAQRDKPAAKQPAPAQVQAQQALQGQAVPATDADPQVASKKVLPEDGVVGWSARDIVVNMPAGGREGNIVLLGEVRLVYTSPSGKLAMSLQAENAVIFLSQSPKGQQAVASQVRGIYLEDNVVVSDGQFTVRAPRVYYDVAQNRAMLLEAVLYTWDPRTQIPIYLRAQKLQQLSRRQWAGEGVIISNSEFARPQIAIGARKLTFEQTQAQGNKPSELRYTAQDVTGRFGDMTFFYWPKTSGDAADNSLRRLTVDVSSRDGLRVLTRWDALALMGEPVPDVELLVDADYNGIRGPGAGYQLRYDRPQTFGRSRAYLLPFDGGEDDIADRNLVPHDDETRGFFVLQHRQLLPDHWQATVEVGYVSDPTFLEEFFRDEAYNQKTYETSLHLKKQEDNWAFAFLVKSDINDFIPQGAALQSPGYVVEKLPEVSYYRVADDLLGDRLSYYTENRLGYLRFRTPSDTPAERGFTAAQSQRYFGIPPTTPFGDRFNLPDDGRLRFDSRHELQAPIRLAMFDVVPFVAGRITAYNEDFEPFTGEDDYARLWGVAGVRTHTEFARVYEVSSKTLDLHRLRHIIEPELEVSLAGATLESFDLPVYDQDVERLSEGGSMRVGLRNTLQTYRGPAPQRRSVDWLVLETDYILRTNDADKLAAIPHHFGYHPDYSIGGDLFHSRLLWMISDSLALTSESFWNAQNDSLAVWRLGSVLQHSPRLQSFVDFSEIEAVNQNLLSYGFIYEMTKRYSLGFVHSIDVGTQRSREVQVVLERRLPRWRFRVYVAVDDLDEDTVVGVRLEPEGPGSHPPLTLPDFRGF